MFNPSPQPTASPLNQPDALSTALALAAEGRSVFPLKPGSKQPLVAWKQFQKRRATGAEIRSWWRQCPNAGVAVVCGRISDLVAVDVDPRNGADLAYWGHRFPETRRTLSGRGDGGGHWWFRHPEDDITVKHHPNGLDVMAGGYVVAPPSLHPEKDLPYTWAGTDAVAALPPWLTWGERPASSVVTDIGASFRPSSDQSSFSDLWAEKGIALKSGDQMYHCPFHDDSTPSLSIDAEAEKWHCFGCDKGGRYGMLWKAVRPGQKPSGRPVPTPMSAADRVVLERCQAIVRPATTPSRSKVYRLVIVAGLKQQTLEPEVSVRTLALDAEVAPSTAKAALDEAVDSGMLQLVTSGRMSVHGSTYRIIDTDSPRSNTSTTGGIYLLAEGVRSERKSSSEAIDTGHDAWAHGALAKTIDSVHYLASVGTATPQELAEALGMAVGTMYAHVAALTSAGYATKNGDGTWSYATPPAEQLDHFAAVSGTTGRHEAARRRYADQRKQWVTTGLANLLTAAARHRAVDEVTGEILRTFPTRDAALEAAGGRFPPPSPEPPDWEDEDTTTDRQVEAA